MSEQQLPNLQADFCFTLCSVLCTQGKSAALQNDTLNFALASLFALTMYAGQGGSGA
jgi:hypothetical protein